MKNIFFYIIGLYLALVGSSYLSINLRQDVPVYRIASYLESAKDTEGSHQKEYPKEEEEDLEEKEETRKREEELSQTNTKVKFFINFVPISKLEFYVLGTASVYFFRDCFYSEILGTAIPLYILFSHLKIHC